MGAGVVKPQPNGPGIRIHIHTGRRFQTPSSNMSTQPECKKCEECGVTFTAFKKKKLCKLCARHFCSACSVQTSSPRDSPREQQCKKCDILISGNFTQTQLTEWKVKDLKAVLNNQNVNTSKCREKDDLIDLVFKNFSCNPNFNRRGTEHQLLVEQLAERMRQQDEEDQRAANPPRATRARDQTQTNPSTSQTSGCTSNTSPTNRNADPAPAAQSGNRTGEGTNQESDGGQQSTNQNEPAESGPHFDRVASETLISQAGNLSEAAERLRQAMDEEEKRETQPENPHTKLEDIKSEAEIESLSIRELKRVLLNNFVDYKGCCEKWELQERVRRLWKDYEGNKKKIEEHRKQSDDPSCQTDLSGAGDEDLCKICMDAAIDCVLLECGHMVTCTNCGKRLSECPICRQFVVRAVHTFKS